MEGIGVYICHCGTNIAGTVDVEEVADFAAALDGVAVARHYAYMCSDPGQDLIKQDIQALGLARVVVASCSPLMHEHTFRRACEEAGLNPFYFQMANIREQCSWVTEDREKATRKAAGIEAALRIADAGKKVYLVEREPSIGGHVAQLHKTFPTLDCAA
jgi:heterodisulfide reductase subunit A